MRAECFVLYQGLDDVGPARQLAEKLALPLITATEATAKVQLNDAAPLFLCWREGCLQLLDKGSLQKGGLYVDITPRNGEQRSWPAPKDGALAQALGRKTKTVVDATTGWGQDSLHIFRMGYELLCLERSPVMAELLADGFRRLGQEDWMRNLKLEPPALRAGDAVELLGTLASKPDCIFLDPMFPAQTEKKSALAKKAIVVLHDLVGDDADKQNLFAAAFAATGKRVVVKSPDYAEPLGGKPSASFQGKLLRYDVYLKN